MRTIELVFIMILIVGTSFLSLLLNFLCYCALRNRKKKHKIGANLWKRTALEFTALLLMEHF